MSIPDNVLVMRDPKVRRPDRAALAGAAVTGVLSFTPLADAPGSVFIAGACLFWLAFVIIRARKDGEVFRHWGFRGDNLRVAAVPAAFVFSAGTAGLGAFAWLQDTFRFPAHTLPLFLVYPAWSLIQQFLMLGVVVNNLERFAALRRRRMALILLVALIFGFLHAFNQRLVAATFLLELAIVPLYLRHRNLWPLGVLHGWLGGLFYLWVENRDLWAERFG